VTRSKPLILNINDDEAGRYATRRHLQQAGFEVSEAGSGETGLRMARDQPADLILLDVRLPDIDGFEVCRRLRADPVTAGVPIIQMSASYLDSSWRVKGLENGADAYLTEPLEPPMLLATIRSLLRMKHAEQAVRQAALRWHTTFHSLQDGAAILDGEGRVMQANEAFRQRMGTDPQSVINLTGGDFERLRSSGVRQTAEKTVAGRTLCIRIDPVREDCEFAGAVCIVQDVTEQRLFEQQQRHTTKLESIGVLAGGIAHDFNNLLTGILGNSSLIEQNLPEESPERALIEEVIKASESAADLTRQILAYSGKGRFVVRPLDLSAIVLESRAFVKRFIPAPIELIYEAASDLPPINADAGQMQQLVMNLIINAAESFGDIQRGAIRVRTSLERLEGSEYVLLTVADNGSGMDEETKERIFDPFFTTKFAGRGLGLSAVQGILQGHKGILWLDSRPGEGSTFKLYFPALHDTRPKEDASSEKRNGKGAGTILVLDDESMVRNFARSALELRGYKVLLAGNGGQGVDIFHRMYREISAVVLDFAKSEADGEEALDKLRAISADVPIVLVSGFSHHAAAEHFRGKAPAGFLCKPFSGAQLGEAVEAAIRGGSARRQNMDGVFYNVGRDAD
jgi:DNA-binding response OmpR family regulator